MKPRHWSGRFELTRLGPKHWQITTSDALGVQISFAAEDFAADPPLPVIEQIQIEWRAATAVMQLTTAAKIWHVSTHELVIHEPRSDIYPALPLQVFGDRAQRFWRRIFWLVRLPGGRSLLRFIARRTRA